MMKHPIAINEIRDRIEGLLAEIGESGESFVIERNGQPIADLAPHAGPVGVSLRSLEAFGRLTVPRADDEFADDLESIRREQPQEPAPKWRF